MPATKLPQKPTTQTKYYPFNGGLDVVTPALSVDPGFALAMSNFEPWFNGGYRRVDGYERFDGRAKPSLATVSGAVISSLSGLPFGTSGTASFDGTGSMSGATARFVEGVLVGGTSYVALTKVGGTFGTGEKVIAGTSTSTGTFMTVPSIAYAPVGIGASGFNYQNEFLANAQAYYRSLINPVPGTGNVLGVWQNGTNIYAVRGTGTAGTPAKMYLASGSGWTTSGLTFVNTMYFTTLGTQGLPANGSIITGAVSAATGTLYSGITHTPTSGYLALLNVTGTYGTSEGLKANGTGFGTSASSNTLFTLPPTGFYRWRNFNFFATSASYYTYGVNGKGPAFQIDNTNIVMPILFPLSPLTNQPANNVPFLLEVYLNTLFLGLPGGVYQSSVPGQPTQFNGFLGASQFSTGAELAGMYSIAGPALALMTAKNSQVLTGNPATVSSLNQAIAAEKAGAILNASQLLDTVYSLNNLGVTSLSRTQSYGNFVGSTISQLVQPIIAALRQHFADSTIVRASNQARFYFDDGSVLVMYVPGLGQQNKAWSAIESGVTAQFGYANYNVPVFNICNSEDATGNEVAYFGASNGDGYAYQDRSGTSWDGTQVTSYLRLAFNNVGTPATRKYFRRADIEINSPAQILLQFVADFSYSNTESSSGVQGLTASNIPVLNVFGGGGFWDSVYWNQFQWDGQAISSARAALNGTGENVSFLVFHQAIVDQPFILQGLVLHFDPRRLQR
jgi:hypothetical protein